MPVRVTLQDIVEAVDLPNRYWQLYVNRESGAIVTVTDFRERAFVSIAKEWLDQHGFAYD